MFKERLTDGLTDEGGWFHRTHLDKTGSKMENNHNLKNLETLYDSLGKLWKETSELFASKIIELDLVGSKWVPSKWAPTKSSIRWIAN